MQYIITQDSIINITHKLSSTGLCIHYYNWKLECEDCTYIMRKLHHMLGDQVTRSQMRRQGREDPLAWAKIGKLHGMQC